MPLAEWSTAFTPTAEDGSPLRAEGCRWSIALEAAAPAHRALCASGPRRRAPGASPSTAFPLEGQGGRHLGAVVIFWEERPS